MSNKLPFSTMDMENGFKTTTPWRIGTNGLRKGVMDSIYVNGRSEGQRGQMDGLKRGESADVRAKWLETRKTGRLNHLISPGQEDKLHQNINHFNTTFIQIYQNYSTSSPTTRTSREHYRYLGRKEFTRWCIY
ncbi:hypothetical protein PSTG_12441 [Puccinia striiformis f. sp. tritici PST-78]|uniref:Uncharacterized protein n=1 Tax=Puccinia striiformis f. sp. tritici PST-78 TaxID=1165861 RepID=A0A0L0V4K8_9BASI|nr:hypothetical protein PSTG_12441 [Puccinia striiformis f. sp. tritici PST-78]